jgi:ankyrin repeat protein
VRDDMHTNVSRRLKEDFDRKERILTEDMKQFFKTLPNIMCGDENAPLQRGENRATPLHLLAQLAGPSNYSTHVNQLNLAKLLIEHEANANAVTIPQGATPLHYPCHSGNVTNLDFVELLLEEGADPNAQDHQGMTPLVLTTKFAPGAAKFLLNWPTTDATITDQSKESFLVRVRRTIKSFFDKIALPDNPEMVQHQLLLQQCSKNEDMVE